MWENASSRREGKNKDDILQIIKAAEEKIRQQRAGQATATSKDNAADRLHQDDDIGIVEETAKKILEVLRSEAEELARGAARPAGTN